MTDVKVDWSDAELESGVGNRFWVAAPLTGEPTSCAPSQTSLHARTAAVPIGCQDVREHHTRDDGRALLALGRGARGYLAAMSSRQMVRKPLRVREQSNRTLEERLALRFP